MVRVNSGELTDKYRSSYITPKAAKSVDPSYVHHTDTDGQNNFIMDAVTVSWRGEITSTVTR